MKHARLAALGVLAVLGNALAFGGNGCGGGSTKGTSGGGRGAGGTAEGSGGAGVDGSSGDGSASDGAMSDGPGVDSGVDHPAMHATAFSDSIGVGVHMGANQVGQAYSDPVAVSEALSWLHITHVRDSVGGASSIWTRAYADGGGPFAAAGVRFDVGFGSGYDLDASADLAPFVAPEGGTAFVDTPLAVQYLESFEGPNEVDNPGSTTPPDYDASAALQAGLWARVQADPALRSKPVLALTVAFAANAADVPDLSSLATFGNMHVYPDNVPPGVMIGLYLTETTDTTGLPMIVTETGYYTRSPVFTDTHAITEDVQAKYLLDAIFDTYSRSIVRTYLYDLVDDGPYVDAGSGTEQQHFGLFHYPLGSPPSGSAKPIATALQNVMTILGDPGPPFTAAPIPFTLTPGADGSAGPQSLLLEKSGGVYELALWVESESLELQRRRRGALPVPHERHRVALDALRRQRLRPADRSLAAEHLVEGELGVGGGGRSPDHRRAHPVTVGGDGVARSSPMVSSARLLLCAFALTGCGARSALGAPDAVREDAGTASDAGAPPPPPDFIWYILDETSGTTATDASPNHYDMTNLAGVTWDHGAIFDGATVCGEASVGPGWREPPVTISAWLAPSARDDQTLNAYALTPFPPSALSGDSPSLGGYGVGLDVWSDGAPGAALAVETGANAAIAFHSLSGAYAASTEYFVVSVIDATSAALYVDGSLLTSVSADVPPAATPTPLHLGCHNDDPGYGTKRFYKGRIRDARVYSRLLGAGEIAQLHAAGPVTMGP